MSVVDKAKNYIMEARDSTTDGNVSRAFDCYLDAFMILPRLKTAYKSKFLSVFTLLLDYLEETKNHFFLMETFKKALAVFPGNGLILTEVGRYLLRNEYYLEAWRQFQDILSEDTSSVNGEFYLNLVKLGMIDRWHYRMLNDKNRNFSYYAAIREVVEPDRDSVLDLGTGSGLLAMYAAKCNPASVVAIESNQMLTKVAEHVAKDNNFPYIHIINKSSYCLNEFDIGGRKSLLITEIFDAGLFGEGVIPTLNHAFKNLLRDNARVLPNRAEFFVQGINCESLMIRYHLNSRAKALLNIPYDKHVLAAYDPYDCADVQLYGDLVYMTEPQSVLEIDFNNAEDLERKTNQIVQYTLQMKPLMDGEVSTIIGWFDLHLTNQVSLTTNPTSEHKSSAWQQAIFNNFLPMHVLENYPFSVALQLINGSKLAVVSNGNIRISETMVRFLNDAQYIETVKTCANASFMYLLQHIPLSQIVIADLSPFPMFGLMMLKRGAQALYCFAKEKNDQDFIVNVFQANYISSDRYKIIDNEHDFMGRKKFHAIYYNIFSSDGCIDKLLVTVAHHMEMNNLIEGGLFIPNNIRVMGQLINSPNLDVINRVYDENTGYMVAPQMNKFQVSVNYAIDFMHFKYTALSEPIVLGYCRSMSSDIIECPVIKDGNANAFLVWYDMKLTQYGGFITTHRPRSFLDGVAFLADPHVRVSIGDIPDIICCVDEDQTFKLIIDND